MNRGNIICLAHELWASAQPLLPAKDSLMVITDKLERFATVIEAEQAETIAAQQARIAELVEALEETQFQSSEVGAPYCDECGEILKHSLGCSIGKALSRTDDLSALNEAKAQVLDDQAKQLFHIGLGAAAGHLMWVAKVLRANK